MTRVLLSGRVSGTPGVVFAIALLLMTACDMPRPQLPDLGGAIRGRLVHAAAIADAAVRAHTRCAGAER